LGPYSLAHATRYCHFLKAVVATNHSEQGTNGGLKSMHVYDLYHLNSMTIQLSKFYINLNPLGSILTVIVTLKSFSFILTLLDPSLTTRRSFDI